MLPSTGGRLRDASAEGFSSAVVYSQNSDVNNQSWLETPDFQNGLAIFRRSLLLSFIFLFLLYEIGFFSALHSALKPHSFNETLSSSSSSSSSASSASLPSVTLESSTSKTETKTVSYYGDESDPYPPEANFFELPRNRKGKCVAVVGLQGTGTVWISLVAQEILTLRKQHFQGIEAAPAVWGLNRGWFSRKGEDYEATIKLLQNEDLVLVNLRYDDLILGQADVILEGYRDLRDYVAFQIPSKKSEKGAFESLSKGFFHLVEWYPHVHHRIRFEDVVKDKASQVRDIAYAIFKEDLNGGGGGGETGTLFSLTDQELKEVIDRVDEKMLKTREFSSVAIHPSIPSGIGAYKTQLSPETLQAIQDQYRPWLSKFGYF